jgi:hypothetical protein
MPGAAIHCVLPIQEPTNGGVLLIRVKVDTLDRRLWIRI